MISSCIPKLKHRMDARAMARSLEASMHKRLLSFSSSFVTRVRGVDGSIQQRLLALSITFMMFVGGVAPSFAQVTLTIPTDDIFTSINNWIATFAPIVAIGIGIAAAIAILTFVGKQIVSAFKA